MDVSQNTALADLWIEENDIQQIDLSQNALLQSLNVDNNELHQLDISNNPELTRLSYSHNYITSVDISNNPNLFSINFSDNDYGPGDIAPKPDNMDVAFYSFSPQKRFILPQTTYNESDTIDLSAQLSAQGVGGPNGPVITTQFTWVDSYGNPLTEGTDYTETEPGKFNFSNPMAGIYVIMQNDAYNYQEEVYDETLDSLIMVDKSLYSHNGIDPNIGEYIIDTDINGDMIFRSIPIDIAIATPITIETFTAVSREGNILLQWHTGTEVNAKGFVVERSADGVNFENIGFVAAKGSNSSYAYTDASPLNGRNTYRLQLTDNDSKAKYSSFVTVLHTQKSTNLSKYPNPVRNGQLSIVMASATQANIYNSAGALVKTFNLQNGRNITDIRNLSAGVYFIKTADGKTASFVVVK